MKGDEQKQAKNAERIIQKVHPMQNDETQSDSQIVALTQGLNISSTNAELMQLSSPRSRATRPARKKPVVYILRDSEDSEPIAQEMISTSTNIPHDFTPCLTLNRSFKDPELPQPATKKKPSNILCLY